MVVESASPDALCPPLEQTRALVAARLGNVELEGTWHATYVLVHRAKGDFVSLRLVDPEGTARLERELPVQGGASCATLSQVIALVLERYFLQPEGETRDSESAPEPPAPASAPPHVEIPLAPAASGATAVPEPLNASPDQAETSAPPPAAIPPGPVYEIGAALWVANDWLTPSLQLARRLGQYRLGLDVGFDLGDHQTAVASGWLSLRREALALRVTRRVTLAHDSEASGGLELLGVVETASSERLPETGSGTRLVPGLGARIGASFWPDSAASPFVDLTGAWLIGAATRAFRVGGNDVLTPRPLVFGVEFGIRTPL